MIYLVTGGAGFVGSNLAVSLKKQYADARVIAFDNLKRRGSELNLELLRQYGIEFVHGDVRNPEDFPEHRIDVLLECSAEPSVLAGFGESPGYLLNTNLVGTLNCMEYVRKQEASIVFFSTSRVYPVAPLNSLAYEETETRFQWTDEQPLPGVSSKGVSESFPLTGARSLYGATKLASELIIQEYQDMYGVPAIINRCGLLSGPRQMGKTDQGVVALWVAKHVYRQQLSYVGYEGQGKQVRDMLHVDDLFRLLQLQLQQISEHSGTVFNVGGGAAFSTSLLELTELCQQATGNIVPIQSNPETRPADLRIYVTDHSDVTEKTGWAPTLSPQVIVEQITRWIQDNYQQLQPILAPES